MQYYRLFSFSVNLAMQIVSDGLKDIPRECLSILGDWKRSSDALPRKSAPPLDSQVPSLVHDMSEWCHSDLRHPSNEIAMITTFCKGPIGGRSALLSLPKCILYYDACRHMDQVYPAVKAPLHLGLPSSEGCTMKAMKNPLFITHGKHLKSFTRGKCPIL